jgi:hypothetical protein
MKNYFIDLQHKFEYHIPFEVYHMIYANDCIRIICRLKVESLKSEKYFLSYDFPKLLSFISRTTVLNFPVQPSGDIVWSHKNVTLVKTVSEQNSEEIFFVLSQEKTQKGKYSFSYVRGVKRSAQISRLIRINLDSLKAHNSS